MEAPTRVIDELRERIGRLERENHRNKIRMLAVLVVALVAVGLLGWRLSAGDALITQRIVLTDALGLPTAELSNSPGGPRLVLLGPDGSKTVLTAGVKASGLMVEDRSGPDISLLSGNQPFLFFGDAGDPRTVLIGLRRGDGPRFQLKDSTRIWLAKASAGGGPALVYKDHSGNVIWSVP